jgi:hypothetical protein
METAGELDATQNSDAITEKRERRLANLRPWPKGVSGNPGGRPKGFFGKAALRQLRKRAENGKSNLDAVVSAQVEKAIRKGDTRSAEFLRDSVDGRPSATNESASGSVTINWHGPAPAWARPDDGREITVEGPSQLKKAD